MTYEEAKTKPLNELLGYLTSLYEDYDCTCQCKMDTWVDEGENGNAEIYPRAEEASKEIKEKCKKRGIYDNCPQRIAYERVLEACERATPKNPKGDYHSVPHFRCPNCFRSVKMYCDDPEIPNCTWCGQALDWRILK